MKFVIQSFSDIITNSSSEVFASQSSDALIKALKEMNIYYVCCKNETELRAVVEENPWQFEELVNYNPYAEWYIDNLRENKTADEIWEFFKSFYMDLVGKIVVNIDRDYLYSQQQKFGINLNTLIKE